MSRRFERADTVRFLRLGKKRPKLQKWRRPRGRHSKIRRKRFSYDIQPGIGFGKPASQRGLVKGVRPILIHNLFELDKVHANKDATVIISSRIGAKKRLEMLKKASEKKLHVIGTNRNRESKK